MKRIKNYRNLFVLLFFCLSFIVVKAEVKLPRLISNGMVLQRDVPLKIWGWADPSEKIQVNFNGKTVETVADAEGNWQLELPPTEFGGPFNMKINEFELTNILIGDVWLCSGQSNMEYPMNRLKDRYAEEIAACSNANIRQFKIPVKYDFNEAQVDYPAGRWEAVNPESILNYSAVAYFFAKELYQKYQVPIGIINASLGGSPAEAWMSADALKDFPNYLAEAKKFSNQSYCDELRKTEQKAIDEWYALMNQSDKGLRTTPTWKDPAFDASSWPEMPVPGYWADQQLGVVNGVIWFRREVDVPANMAGKPAHLLMGRIVDADSIFINGKFVGTTSYQYPQRNYHVPSGVLKAGKNTIVVRLISNSGRGGFVPDKPYQLFAGQDTVNLDGYWHYQLGCTMTPTPGTTFIRWKPMGLYNGMIAPSNNFAIKGAVWYQGEANTSRYQEYQKLLTELISDWRLKRAQGNFPFIVAQLPNFMESKKQPDKSDWAAFRNEQLKVAQTVENTAITVNIDLGDWNDIHPQNKLDVGRRLALAAKKLAYGDEDLVASGPIFQSMKTEGNKIILTFSSVSSGIYTNNLLEGFAIAGEDGNFEWAKAVVISKNQVKVWCDDIEHPVTVRYAWADNPKGANLKNLEGLPASPFTTDN